MLDIKQKIARGRELMKESTARPWHYDGEAFIFGPHPKGPVGHFTPVAEIRGFGAGLPMDKNAETVVHSVNNFESLAKRVELLEQALEWYADRHTWSGTDNAANRDGGELARAAIEGRLRP